MFLAIHWCGYLESHARRIYGMANNITHQAAIKLAEKIKQGELKTSFTIRDIYRKEWTLLDEKEIVKKACDELVDAGWICQELQSHEIGRPKSPIFIVNPKLKIDSSIDINLF